MNAGLGIKLEGRGEFPAAVVWPSTGKGYLIVACEIDHPPPFGYFLESAAKKVLLKELRATATKVRGPGVEETVLLKAAVVPPGGGGAYLQRRPDAHLARFDIAFMVQTRDLDAAMALRESGPFKHVRQLMRDASPTVYDCAAENPCGLGPVDHSRGGVFLINYFLSSSPQLNLWVWQYTAGWFQEQTGLDNSVVMQPVVQSGAAYTLLNHCRWPRLRKVLPSLLFKRSFRRYVLGHFDANETAPMPVLYRLA